MRAPPNHLPIDAAGNPLKAGDIVRIIGIPDLSGMSAEAIKDSRPVFEWVVGKYKRIQEFDEYGFAWFTFRYPTRNSIYHCIAVEPDLLRIRVSRKAVAKSRNI